jgi:hypothetical protein
MKTNPLTSKILASAFQNMIHSSEFICRVKWWLIFGHSIERWLQLEYAYFLQLVCNEVYRNKYVMACEQKHADIVLYEESSLGDERPLPKEDGIVSKIEMKFNGNWYIYPSIFSKINDDVNKVKGYKVPSIVLSFWLFAKPNIKHELNLSKYTWIEGQIKSRREKYDIERVNNELKKCSPHFKEISDYHKSETDFENLDFYLFEYRK